jgi:hypothetical protein
MSENSKYIDALPPSDDLLPKADAVNLIVGSTAHINLPPA